MSSWSLISRAVRGWLSVDGIQADRKAFLSHPDRTWLSFAPYLCWRIYLGHLSCGMVRAQGSLWILAFCSPWFIHSRLTSLLSTVIFYQYHILPYDSWCRCRIHPVWSTINNAVASLATFKLSALLLHPFLMITTSLLLLLCRWVETRVVGQTFGRNFQLRLTQISQQTYNTYASWFSVFKNK